MHNPRINKIALAALTIASIAVIGAPSYAAHSNNYKGEVVEESTTVVATPVQHQSLKDGPYVGVGLGYDSYRIKQSSSFADDDGDVFGINPPLNGKSFAGSIFAGYGQYFNNLYLAGELNYNLSDADANYTIGNAAFAGYNASVSGRNSFGIHIIPGVKLSDNALLYAKVGYVRTNFKATESLSGASVGQDYSTSVNKNVSGVNYGLGLETLVAEKVSVRGEYNYISYNSFKNATSGSKFTPSDNQFMLGVVYHLS